MFGEIVRLNRSLYGLKQSGRQWAGLVADTAVVEYGMEAVSDRSCVFVFSVWSREEQKTSRWLVRVNGINRSGYPVRSARISAQRW